MWKCKKCGEVLEDSFDSCWQCNTPNDGSSPRLPNAPGTRQDNPKPGSRPQRGSPTSAPSAIKRYNDAYLVAITIAAVGRLIKAIALFLGALIALAALYEWINEHNAAFALAAIFAAFILSIPVYILGILVAAQGQILKSTLDTAVTNSPFLTRDDMAKVMSL
jgi:hypothetical protein